MLGLCSPKPHFALLREEIVYGKRQNQKRLNLEFQELKKMIPFDFKMDNIIDDWVLMCFLEANDFLSHFPNLHIAYNALPVLYQAYIDVMPSLGGYINEYGKLNLERFEKFLTRISQFGYEKFTNEKTKDPDEKRLLEKFSHLDIHDFDSGEDQEGLLEMEFRQQKAGYYVNKLEYSDVNKQVM
ncbi:hypothetical protein MRX96_013585 [Rhipicephalus microplus]